MPVSPVNEILPPIDPSVNALLEQFAQLIDETINFGTHVLAWQMNSAVGGDEVAPVTLSIRHILELLGATSSNVRSSHIDPCKILLRATLESFLGLAYILKEDSVRRGHAFLTVDAHQRLKNLKMLDLSRPESKKLEEKLSTDIVVPKFAEIIPQDSVKKSIASLEAFLKTPGAKEPSEELRKLKNKSNKNPNWYSLYGGPVNLERLAFVLGYQSLYHFLYKYWSRATHGTDILPGKMGYGPNGRPGIVQLRLPVYAETITQVAVTIALTTYRLTITKYSPDKHQDLGKWYIAEIQKLYLELGKEKIINVSIPNGTAHA